MDVSDEMVTEGALGLEKRWRVDRKITLGMMLALALNLFGAVWFVAQLDGRVARVEEWTKANAGTEHRLTQVEASLEVLINRHQQASR